MRRLVRSLGGLSAVALLAATTAPGLAAQADATKQAPPAAEKKQTPAAEKKATPQAGKHVMLAAADLKWAAGPDGLPAGGQFAVVDGDPGKPGLFTIRVKLPDAYTVPPHWHPTDEHVTVLSGTLTVGLGSKWDDSAMHEITAGGYARMPRKTNHFAKAKGETTFQITGMGPFAITYVDPKDDPRKKGGTD